MGIIYGPVPSWRLGKSLGIDLLSTQGKTCSFDCVYCQLGRTISHAQKITQQDVLNALDGLPEESQHCALLAANTLKAAVKDYLAFKNEPWKRAYNRH